MPTVPVPAACQRLAKAARSAGFPLYLVGGAVRNPLLGLPIEDVDLCGPRRPEDLSSHEAGIEIRDTVNGLGTAIIRCPEDTHTRGFEYTAFRIDSYASGGSHIPARVEFTDSMEVDAERRDFTLNALYADPLTGDVLDPLGMGVRDLESRILRMVRPKNMAEDALRILRMVRFASELDLEVDPATMEAARANVSGLSDISHERICKEFFRILLSDVPYGARGGPERGLFMLRDMGALTYVVPELMEGAGFAQNPQYHRYDVLDHQLHACVAAPPDLTTRLAALLHDVAKPSVYSRDGNMYAHAREGAEMAGRALSRLHAPTRVTSDVRALVAEHMFDLDANARARAIRRRILDLGQEQFQRLINLRVADFVGSGMGHDIPSARNWQRVLDAMTDKDAPLRISDLAVNGSDLMRELDIPAGPQVGELLQKLLLYVAGKPSQNSYECLLRYARMICGTRRPGGGRSDRDGQ